MLNPQTRETILVVDDSPDTLEVLRRNLEEEGFAVECAPGVAQAVDLLSRQKIDVVITDLKMPGASGLDLVRHVRENYKQTEILMITGFPSVEGAVQALKSGAEDYLAKPFTTAELFSTLRRALDKLRARRSLGPEASEVPAERFAGLTGESEAMQAVYRALRECSGTGAPVMISGETGTGKKTAARAIHEAGKRHGALFLCADLAAMPPEKVESDLFGEPGDNPANRGLLATAAGGTLLLENIETLSPALQGRLLEWIERSGGACSADSPRLLASTSFDPHALAGRGRFSHDLLRHFSASSLALPPLRRRGNDLLLLLRQFSAGAAQHLGLPCPTFTDRAVDTLRAYSWPGNVAELSALVRRLVDKAAGETIDVPDLPPAMRFSLPGSSSLDRPLAEVEAAYIQEVLAAVNGNRTRAAEILGIDRKTLREKLRRT